MKEGMADLPSLPFLDLWFPVFLAMAASKPTSTWITCGRCRGGIVLQAAIKGLRRSPFKCRSIETAEVIWRRDAIQ